MPVYNLTPPSQFNVLLTGDPHFVVQFAEILEAKGVPFDIFARPDLYSGLEMDEYDGAALDEAADTAAEFGAYADRVVTEDRESMNTFTHIIDLSITPPFDRARQLEIAAARNVEATIIMSALTTTATELGMMAGCPGQAIGVSLAPSILSSVPFVEMSAGLNTNDRHVVRARQLFEHLGYTVEQVEDRVALVQMRVLATIINEAAFAVMEGVASPQDIDQAMKLGTNYPKGPLAWADEIGLPYILLILDALYREYQQERYRPCVLLKQYVRAGWLGRSSGRGFYVYET